MNFFQDMQQLQASIRHLLDTAYRKNCLSGAGEVTTVPQSINASQTISGSHMSMIKSTFTGELPKITLVSDIAAECQVTCRRNADVPANAKYQRGF